MHRGCFVWTPTPSLAGRRTPRPGPVRVCVCLLFLAGSGGPASRARCGAPHLFLWPLCLSALLGPLRAGVAPLSFAAVAVPRWLFFSASRCLARASFVSPAWPLAALWWLLPCPPPPLCLAVFVAPACGLGVFFFFFFFSPSSSSSVRPRCLRLSLVSGPGCPGPRRLRCVFCWPSASRLSVRFSLFRAFRLAVGCFRVVAAPPPPLCVSRFSFLPLGAVCRVVLCVPGCGAAACCAVPSGAARRPGALCSAALCFAVFPRAVCSVLCVFCRGAVVPAVVRRFALCCVCLGVLCCAFPVLSVLCGAVLRCAGALALCCSCGACCCWRLVLWCSAVCCAVSCGVPWCGAGSGGPWLSAGGVCGCRCPCLAAWSASLWLVWFAGLLWCPAFLCRVLWCCAVAWCCAVVLCCRVAVLLGLALPSCGLSCCAVLCCWLAVLFLARWWCLRAVVLFSSRCVFPVFSVLCAAVPCCAGCGALPPCVVCCGAVLGVVLCCRALLSLCGAVCVRFALLRPVVRRLCGLRCCWCLVLWLVPVRCGVSLGVLRCGGAALVCRGVVLCCALSCGVLRSVPCPAVSCCPAVLCCLFFLLSCFPLLKTPAVFPRL